MTSFGLRATYTTCHQKVVLSSGYYINYTLRTRPSLRTKRLLGRLATILQTTPSERVLYFERVLQSGLVRLTLHVSSSLGFKRQSGRWLLMSRGEGSPSVTPSVNVMTDAGESTPSSSTVSGGGSSISSLGSRYGNLYRFFFVYKSFCQGQRGKRPRRPTRGRAIACRGSVAGRPGSRDR